MGNCKPVSLAKTNTVSLLVRDGHIYVIFIVYNTNLWMIFPRPEIGTRGNQCKIPRPLKITWNFTSWVPIKFEMLLITNDKKQITDHETDTPPFRSPHPPAPSTAGECLQRQSDTPDTSKMDPLEYHPPTSGRRLPAQVLSLVCLYTCSKTNACRKDECYGYTKPWSWLSCTV